MISEDNKRILRNSAMLYGRMFLSLCISLFTSREVLRILGVEDYGVYSIAGGVIGMFMFLRDSMTGASSRFLTYELGRGNFEALKKTFGASLMVHIAIALITIVLAETLGLWYVLTKLNVPEGSREAAMWVYQLSVFSAALGTIQVPYNAVLVSHEKLDWFAGIEILNLALKLVILYLLFVLPGNKLIVYAFLVFIVSILISAIYFVVSFRVCKEVRTGPNCEWGVLKPMLAFSGWDLLGNLASTARFTGVAMVLNYFFGAIVNAAAGIATQVQGVVMGFANNITMSIKPQIIKSYAAGDYARTKSLIIKGSTTLFALLLFLSLPLMANMDFILHLWLVDVPQYAVSFAIASLFFNIFVILSIMTITGCHATGHIKRPSLFNGILYMAVLPASYIMFKYFDGNPVFPYVFNAIVVLITAVNNVYVISRTVSQITVKDYFREGLLKCLMTLAISIVAVYLSGLACGSNGWIRLGVTTAASCLAVGILSWNVLLPATVKAEMQNFIRKKKWIYSQG